MRNKWLTHWAPNTKSNILRKKTFGSLFEIATHLSEPFADHSIVPTYLYQFCRQHVTVALGGDGGDDHFGYPTFVAEKMTQMIKNGPFITHFLGNIGNLMARLIPVSHANMPLGLKSNNFLAVSTPTATASSSAIFNRHDASTLGPLMNNAEVNTVFRP